MARPWPLSGLTPPFGACYSLREVGIERSMTWQSQGAPGRVEPERRWSRAPVTEHPGACPLRHPGSGPAQEAIDYLTNRRPSRKGRRGSVTARSHGRGQRTVLRPLVLRPRAMRGQGRRPDRHQDPVRYPPRVFRRMTGRRIEKARLCRPVFPGSSSSRRIPNSPSVSLAHST